ncbi:hypothetical protein BDR04DRAFT_1118121 [Suillus decipiens]|nr:hypothetical protein BDR04DRAFT_1118121 [Suillus decipiens]
MIVISGLLLSNTDSSAHGKSDNELASSLMELDLTDDEVKHLDSKVKRALSPDKSLLGVKVVVQKKIKKETASFCSQVPAAILQLKNKLSSPPEFMSVSKDDVVWCNKPEDDDAFALEHINPWDSHYVMTQNPATFLI